ncbi:MAG TPA: MarR family transcriptional regulator [Clostridia bacterium]|nr:MarR family transcriptional regulator [Clostridia bacterium]
MRTRLHTALIEASGMHSRRSRQDFQKLDLSYGQPKVLEYLLKNENCPQNEIAERCMVEPATMTVLLRNMVNKGLILKKSIRVSCGKHAYGISLTELGREKALDSIEIILELEEASFKGFSEDDKDKLVELLEKVTKNLSEK